MMYLCRRPLHGLLCKLKKRYSMKNVLIVSGHTNLDASVANKTILDTLAARLPEAEIVKLDKLYPDFRINVEAEQQRLVKADIIVLQFPVFWYGAPSLLSRWMEETFQHGFSHGSTGDKLKGKKLVISLTTGAPEEMYAHDGAMGHTIDEFLYCFESACRLCQMEYSGYVYTGGVSYGNRTVPAQIEEQQAKSVDHADRLIAKLRTL